MKESEAKTKLCHKCLDTNRTQKCIINECMAWEPEYNKEHKIFDKGEIIPDDWIKTNKFIAHEYHRHIKTDSGNCGLLSKECNCQC